MVLVLLGAELWGTDLIGSRIGWYWFYWELNYGVLILLGAESCGTGFIGSRIVWYWFYWELNYGVLILLGAEISPCYCGGMCLPTL